MHLVVTIMGNTDKERVGKLALVRKIERPSYSDMTAIIAHEKYMAKPKVKVEQIKYFIE